MEKCHEAGDTHSESDTELVSKRLLRRSVR